MKTYKEVEKNFQGTGIVPNWYDHEIHAKVLIELTTINHGKLHACKYLRDISNKLKMFDETEELFLKEAKIIVDFICSEPQLLTISESVLYKTISFISETLIAEASKITKDPVQIEKHLKEHALLNDLKALKPQYW